MAMDIRDADAGQLDKFRWYVRERADMLNKRVSGMKPPWTESEELRNHRFCNVFRVCDRGSQFMVRMMNSMPEGTSEVDDAALAFAYRRTNRADGWAEAVGRFGIPTHDTIIEWLHEVDGSGIMIHTSQAYNVATGREGKGMSIVAFLAGQMESLVSDGFFERFVSQDRFRDQLAVLMEIPRIGKFMAQQIVTDYGYGRAGCDRYENRGVVAGPGSKRGVKWIFPNDDVTDLNDDGYIPVIHEWLMAGGHPKLEADGVTHDMTLMDTQNCLCEFDKLNRIQSGRGFRRKFDDSGTVRPIESLVVPNSWKEA